jgi:hypothetical protein
MLSHLGGTDPIKFIYEERIRELMMLILNFIRILVDPILRLGAIGAVRPLVLCNKESSLRRVSLTRETPFRAS